MNIYQRFKQWRKIHKNTISLQFELFNGDTVLGQSAMLRTSPNGIAIYLPYNKANTDQFDIVYAGEAKQQYYLDRSYKWNQIKGFDMHVQANEKKGIKQRYTFTRGVLLGAWSILTPKEEEYVANTNFEVAVKISTTDRDLRLLYVTQSIGDRHSTSSYLALRKLKKLRKIVKRNSNV